MNIRYLLLLVWITGISISCVNKEDIVPVEPDSSIINPLSNIIPGTDLMHSSKDSLLQILPTLKDEDQLNIYNQLSLKYVWSWPDSAIEYSTEGLRLAEKLELPDQQITFLSRLTAAYSQIGNFSIALEKGFKEIEIAKKLKDPDRISSSLSDLGAIYFYAEDYPNALPYFLDTKKYTSSFQKNKKLYSTFIGETYFHLNNFDSAYFYMKQAYDLEVKDLVHWCVPYLYMGKLAEQKGQYSVALQFYKDGISKNVPESDYIKTYLNIANIYKIKNELDSGIYYSKLAYSISQNTSLYIFSFGAASLLKELYSTSHQIDSAYKYQEIMLFEKDRLFSREKLAQLQTLAFDEEQRQNKIKQDKEEFRRRIISYALAAGIVLFGIIVIILVRNNRFKQKAYRLLEKQKTEIDVQKSKVETTLSNLKATQAQLIQSEKMASLGELTAGIAHEIQNPLNFVNNFSEINIELAAEINDAAEKGDLEEVKALTADIRTNQEKIRDHGKRADAIVKGMLQHSRSSSGEKEPTDINALADKYLRLAYYGLRSKDKSFNATINTDFDQSIGNINIIPQDIGRVLLNLINNAFYAVDKKKKLIGKDYEPEVTVSTRLVMDPNNPPIRQYANSIIISVRDNGNGISENNRNKIFQPFFTTKPTGEGTGLGLSLSYDIIKAHGGEIRVESKEGEGSIFTVTL